MVKKSLIIIAVIALITMVAVFGLNRFEQPPPGIPDIIAQEPPHLTYLKDFLADTGLTFVPATKNDFAYYKLHTADEELAGFIFLGNEEGWGGPINLFVKTDAAGIIQRL